MPEPMSNINDVMLFTIDWRNRTQTNRLIASLAELDSTLYIIVNDDLQIDYTIPPNSVLRVKIHQTGKNRGFAAACNIALEIAQREGFDYLMHFNNDITVTDISKLIYFINIFKNNTNFAVISPTVLSLQGVVEFAGYNWLYKISPALLISKKQIPPTSENHILHSDFFIGACFITRIAPALTSGGFDEEYFAYREEHDFAARLNKDGWQVGYAPCMTVIHNTSASSSRYPYLKDFLINRGQILYLRKNLKGTKLFVYSLILIFKISAKLFCSVLTGRKYVGPAILDALLNQFCNKKITLNLENEKLIL